MHALARCRGRGIRIVPSGISGGSHDTTSGTAVLFIAIGSGVFVASSSEVNSEAGSQAVSCLVTTLNGDVQGVDNGASCAFLGIPFAAPPVGALRWKPPQPAAPWAPATLNATVAPPAVRIVNPPGAQPPAAARTA